jgi:hypothetical protein
MSNFFDRFQDGPQPPAQTPPANFFDQFEAEPNDYVTAAAQGLSLGTSDELEAAGSAALGGLSNLFNDDGTSFSERYDARHQKLNDRMDEFKENRPITDTAVQIGAAIPAGVIAGGKMAATKAGQAVMPWVKSHPYLSASLAGGSENALYGAATAREGERTENIGTDAAIGAVLAPGVQLAAKGAGNGIMAIADKVRHLLTTTPKSKADDLIRQIARDEGLSNGDVRQLYDELGPEGMVMDVSEGYRQIGKAVGDESGQGKRQFREALDGRQEGQQGRLLESISRESGIDASDANTLLTKMKAERSAQAKPLYDAALAVDVTPSPNLLSILERPSVKKAMTGAQKIAADLGEPIDSGFNLMKRMHYAKMDMDSEISKRIRSEGMTNRVRGLLQAKNDLLGEMDKVSGDYGKARQIWSDGAAIDNAVSYGNDIFKLKPSDIRELTTGMTEGEAEAFKAGAIEAITDKLGDTNLTHDSVKKLIGSENMRARMGSLFKTEDSFNRFIDAATTEGSFMRTRKVVTQGSPTSQNLKGGAILEDAALGNSILRGDSVGAGMAVIEKVFGKGKVDSDMVNAVSDIIGDKSLTGAQLEEILRDPVFQQHLSRRIGNVPILGASGASAILAQDAQ